MMKTSGGLLECVVEKGRIRLFIPLTPSPLWPMREFAERRDGFFILTAQMCIDDRIEMEETSWTETRNNCMRISLSSQRTQEFLEYSLKKSREKYEWNAILWNNFPRNRPDYCNYLNCMRLVILCDRWWSVGNEETRAFREPLRDKMRSLEQRGKPFPLPLPHSVMNERVLKFRRERMRGNILWLDPEIWKTYLSSWLSIIFISLAKTFNHDYPQFVLHNSLFSC